MMQERRKIGHTSGREGTVNDNGRGSAGALIKGMCPGFQGHRMA